MALKHEHSFVTKKQHDRNKCIQNIRSIATTLDSLHITNYIICKYSNLCETTLVSLETLTLGLAMNSTLVYNLVSKLCEEILWRTLCVVSCSLLDPQIEL